MAAETHQTFKKRKSLITSPRGNAKHIDWDTLFEEYIRSKEAGGTRDSTLRSYRYDLVPWKKFCGAHDIPWVGMVKTRDIEDYLLEQKQAGKAISSRRNRAIVLQQVLKFAHKRGYLASERLYGYQIIKAEVADVYTPTLDEVRVIVEAIDHHWSAIHNTKARYRSQKSRTFFRRRDTAIVAVQSSVGLRPGETFALILSDYDPKGRHIHVRHSKTRKSRYVPVTEQLAEIIDEWLVSRPNDSPTDYLFVTDCGTQLHLDSWGHQFQRYVAYARAQGHALPRITLYSLRHVAGTAIAEGSNVYHAGLLLGNDAATAEKHYVRVKMETIRAVHAANDPLAGIFRKTRTVEGAKKARPPRLV